MSSLIVRRQGLPSIGVILKTDDGNLKSQLRHFLSPYFSIFDSDVYEDVACTVRYERVSVTVWELILSKLSWKFGHTFFDRNPSQIQFYEDDERKVFRDIGDTERVIYCYDNNNCWDVIHCVDEVGHFNMCLARLIRKISQSLLDLNRYVTVHGSSISIGDASVLIVGNKKSGKTSTLLEVLRRGGSFITNDKATIDLFDGRVIGWPNAVNVRQDTLKKFFDLQSFDRSVYDSDTKMVVPSEYLRDGTITMSIKELFKRLNIPLSVKAREHLKAIIFPEFGDGLEASVLTQMNRVEGLNELSKHVLVDFSLSIFPATNSLVPSFSQLSEVSFYRLRQNFETLDTSVDLIFRLLES